MTRVNYIVSVTFMVPVSPAPHTHTHTHTHTPFSQKFVCFIFSLRVRVTKTVRRERRPYFFIASLSTLRSFSWTSRRVLRNKQPLNCELPFVIRVDGLCRRRRDQRFLCLCSIIIAYTLFLFSFSKLPFPVFRAFPFPAFREHPFTCLYSQSERK